MAHQHTNSVHAKGHTHGSSTHSHDANKKALLISFILITIFMFIEFIGGWWTNSLALLSDAGHMLSDSCALGLSLGAVIIGQKSASLSKTYGYKRFEILAALANALMLIVISIYICKEAILRFSEPPKVVGGMMMVISVIGLLINIVVAIIISRGQKDNLNIKSAYLHVLGDLLGSVGAIIAAVLILAFGWYIADPIASIITSGLILFSGWGIMKESLNVLMESKPKHIDIERVVASVRKIEGVEDIHDLHVWMITLDFPALTAHVNVKEDCDRDLLLEQIIELIVTETGITHTTIQLEGRTLSIHSKSCSDCTATNVLNQNIK